MVSRRSSSIVACAALVGCTHIPPTTMDEWRQAQGRHIAGLTVPQFERAMQRVFDASVPGAYSVRPAKGGAIAERHWFVYAVMAYARGLEHWQIDYAPSGGGIDAHIDEMNIPADSLPINTNGLERPDSPATYDLFWDRLDYLIGRRADWPMCHDYFQSLRWRSYDEVQSWGLCGVGSSDVVPARLVLVAR